MKPFLEKLAIRASRRIPAQSPQNLQQGLLIQKGLIESRLPEIDETKPDCWNAVGRIEAGTAKACSTDCLLPHIQIVADSEKSQFQPVDDALVCSLINNFSANSLFLTL